jgi:serine/threonine-protein kinase
VLRPVEGAPIRSTDDLIGRRLADRYSVDAIIGRGGMSVVFSGTDHHLRRKVAIKVYADLHGGRAKKLTYRHFVQEAFALSRLNHPSTLRIYDFGIIDHPDLEVPFQVSELMDGGTLKTFVEKKGPQSVEDALYILEGIGGALSEAHSHGIIHRDVKPTNILFGRAGHQRIVKLSDFSVAHSPTDVGPSDDTIVTAASFYSLGWSPPEQIRGERVDLGADVYGLGLVLAYLLSGRRVRDLGELSDFFLPALEIDTRLQVGLDTAGIFGPVRDVIALACRSDPRERYPTVEAFVLALRDAVRRDPGPWMEASPLPPPDRSRAPSCVIADLDASDLLFAGRRVRMFEVLDAFDHEVEDGARVRITFLPSRATRTRIHVRGLNCFLCRPGGRMTAGVEIDADGELGLRAPDKTTLGDLRIAVAELGERAWILSAADLRLAVPADLADGVACFDGLGGNQIHLFFTRRSR